MRANPVIDNLLAYHRAMGRDLAECIVTAAAGEAIGADDLAVIAVQGREQMLSDIRANFSGYGTAPELVAAYCKAASDEMSQHLANLLGHRQGGNA